MKCRSCGREFDPKQKKRMRGGYIDQCPTCSHSDRQKMYLGRPGATHKGSNIEIFRSDLDHFRRVLKRESAIGFNANLGISHPVAVQKIEDKKSEK